MYSPGKRSALPTKRVTRPSTSVVKTSRRSKQEHQVKVLGNLSHTLDESDLKSPTPNIIAEDTGTDEDFFNENSSQEQI